jgi:SAM-dependent methyltransferase
MLIIPERDIRRHGPGNLLAVAWRQWRAERALARRSVHFRTTEPDEVAAAYAAMTDPEFNAINGRQDWANWRTIPRALSGHIPDRPLRVLDLGCGPGSSTRVLAFYCPLGSHLTGYELAASLVAVARRRSYPHRSGTAAQVDFCCQPVTEPLRQANGSQVPDQSVDVASASGVVGHHLSAETVPPLVRELRRVLVAEGVALLDVGPTLPEGALVPLLERAGFRRLGHYRSCACDPTGQVVFQAVTKAAWFCLD